MRAMLMDEYASHDAMVLRQVDAPVPGPSEVRISVRAAGLNFADLLMVAGKYQVKPPLPFAAGMEVAGVISAFGSDVEGFAIGDRVMALSRYGGFAEEVCVERSRAFPIPAGVAMETAAAVPVAYGTVYHALVDRAKLAIDEWLVVYGAGSGVGLVAVEMGAMMGARVIAVAGSAEKLEVARSYGAAHLVNYKDGPVRDAVRGITGKRGADVFFDPVGGDLFDEALRCIAPEGRLLVVGFASGRIPAAAANLLLLKSCQVVGVNTAALINGDPAAYARRFDTMLRWIESGRLKPLVSSTWTLDQVPQAMDALAGRGVAGKIVIRVSAG